MRLRTVKYLGMALVFGISGLNAANCPTLTLADLPTAACSTKQAPYKPSAVGGISYHAKTPCPAGSVGIRKQLQALFKGKKDYVASSEAVVPGEVTCTYTLDQGWKTALSTTDASLVLTAAVSTRDQANLLGVGFAGLTSCPALKFEDLQGGSVTIQSKQNNVSYTFKVQEATKAGFGAKLKAMVGKAPTLSPLNGTFKVTKPYTSTCRYSYHIGGQEALLELEGSTAQ